MTKRILLIDDEPDITFTIKDILEDNGFQVDSFNDPILALNYYTVNFYDLVILDNALKFTQEGFIIITTRITNKEKYDKDNKVIVIIKDTGIGIDNEILPRLFTKFVTKSNQGTGLGLFIVKKIIEAHGGKIWAENNSNGIGSTFYFTLPIVKTSEIVIDRG